MESFDRENAFGILLQQHEHCHRKIHTQNACHNIPRGKTQKGMLATCLPTIHNAAVTCTAFTLKEVHVQFNG